MSDIEKFASPVLKPLIRGESSVLTLRDQLAIVVWMFKTAAMFDLHASERAPRPRYFPDEELRTFATTRSFNPAYSFYVGKYTGVDPFQLQETHSDVEVVNTRTNRREGNALWGYALTIVINKLILQSFCARTALPLPFYVPDFQPFAHQIATYPPIPVRWPPPLALGDPMIYDFVERWSAQPPPPSS